MLCSQAAEGGVVLPAEPSKETFKMNTQETNANKVIVFCGRHCNSALASYAYCSNAEFFQTSTGNSA